MRTPHWCGVVLSGLVVAAAIAGPLDPPAGPIAPTPGSEARIAINAANTPGDVDSVFKITQSGSYYLAGNVTVSVAGKMGIELAARLEAIRTFEDTGPASGTLRSGRERLPLA